MTSWATHFEPGDVAWLLIMSIAPMVFTTTGLALVLRPRLGEGRADRVWARLPVLLASLSLAWGLGIYSLAFGPSWGTVPRSDAGEIQPMRSLQEIAEDDASVIDETASFGRGGFIGGPDYMGMRHVVPVARTNHPQFPSRRPHTHVPHILECLFRGTGLLLAIVPLWIVWSQRFHGALLGVVGILWSCLIFAPIAHWSWGDGWLAEFGTIDFGGGLIVIAAACSGLAWRQPASDADADERQRSAYDGWGAMLIWLGAALFISAQTFHADGRAVLALVNVFWGTSAAILMWCFANGFVWKRPGSHSMVVSVAAGAVGMAPLAGVVQPQSGMIVGAFVGFLANAWFHLGLRKGKATQSLYCSTLAIAAVVGMLGAGLFATTTVALHRWDGRPMQGLIEGEPFQLVPQVVGIVSAGAWAFAASWLLYYLLERCQTLVRGDGGEPISPDAAEQH